MIFMGPLRNNQCIELRDRHTKGFLPPGLRPLPRRYFRLSQTKAIDHPALSRLQCRVVAESSRNGLRLCPL
jgi:hypothetical protein